jgi:hypothetical protein
MKPRTGIIRVLRLLALLLLLDPCIQFGDVVINEIMFHPAPGRAQEEFVELHNPGTTAVNLAGWRLDNAVRYQFDEITLPPGGYLVVAADRAALAAAYPGVSPVVGDWRGRLSNRAETIVLRDALGRIVGLVPYADEGDWASRVQGPLDFGHRGWIWHSPADGGGHSLELLHSHLPNETGQSWASSRVVGGTPGEANSTWSSEVPPLILDVQHTPWTPRSSDTVRVTARLVTLPGGDQPQVTLYYRLDGPTPGAFAAVLMQDDGAHGDGWTGDQVYGAVLPPQPHGSIVEFYLRATDAAGRVRTWPAPARLADGELGQQANLLYQVEDPDVSVHAPVYRLILTTAERAALAEIGSRTPDRQSNAQFNATWISDDGNPPELRYLVAVRHRGHGSRGLQPNNFRVNFRSDDLWRSTDELNLNGQYSYLQHLGSILCRHAGLPAAASHAAGVRVNGADPAALGAPQLTYGRYAVNEALNGNFVGDHFPDDDNGDLYQGRAADVTNQEADFRYLGPDPAPYRPVYLKRTNTEQDDWSGLIELCRAFAEATPDLFAERMAEVIHIDGWLRYFAVMTLLDNRETALHTGFGDDFALYAGVNDPRFHLIPHDLDTILGQGNVPGAIDAPLFAGARIPALDRLLRSPEIAPRYFAILRHLIKTTFAPQTFGELADQALRPYVPLALIDTLKRFAAARADHIDWLLPNRLTVEGEWTQSSELRSTRQTFVDLHGRSDAVRTRRVIVHGIEADWSAWEASWAMTGIPLAQGLNRISVSALDSDGTTIEDRVIHIWRTPEVLSTVSPVIDEDTVWTPDAGPYQVAEEGLVVRPGAMLTLRGGTTVLFSPGAWVRVEGQWIAEGNARQPVVLASEPTTSAAWGGLMFTNPDQESRLSHCILVGAGDQSAAIRVHGGSLRLERCDWIDPAGPAIETHDASLFVVDCDFSRCALAPVISAIDLPIQGRVLIEGSQFGPATGERPAIEVFASFDPHSNRLVELRENRFAGGTGDGVALNHVDAYLDGNEFFGHRNPVRADRHAVALALHGPARAVLARNRFLDNDTAILGSQGASMRLEHNTITGSAVAAIVRGHPSMGLSPPGSIHLEGNILWANATDVANWSVGTLGGDLLIERTLLSVATDFPGTDQISVDPRFVAPGVDLRLQLDSPARGAGRGGMDLGAYVPRGAWLSRESSLPTFTAEARFAVLGAGVRAYRYRLVPDALGGAWPMDQLIHLRGLSEGGHMLEVEGLDAGGRWQPVVRPEGIEIWHVGSGTGGVILSEILAANRSIDVGSSRFPDLVELFHSGTQLVDLGGMSLTDDPDRPRRFVFPPATILQPGQYLVLYADSASSPPGHHLGFALGRDGEGLYLYDHPARGGTLLDAVVFGPQLEDLSIGRNAAGTWELNHPTFGGPNVPHPVSEGRDLKINEWLTASRVLALDDFVELHNTGSLPVSLGGFHLSDRPFSDRFRHRIADLSFVAAGGFIVFDADGRPDRGPKHMNFRLSVQGGQISLFDEQGREIDGVLYGPQAPDVAEGRTPDGSQRIEPLRAVTPNGPNPRPLSAVRSETAPLVALESPWRFHQGGVDLGQAWRAPDYDDSSLAWESGYGLFHANLPNLPGRLSTPLSLRTPAQTTVYFRTLFVYEEGATTSATLSLRHVADDGLAVHLNGAEIYRFNLPIGPVTYGTYASTTIGIPELVGPIILSAAALRPGLNVLAAEVHQSGPESGDMAFGLSLDVHLEVTSPFPPPGQTSQVTEFNGLRLDRTTHWSPGLGEIHLWGDVFVPHPHTLVIGPGTTVRLAPGVSIRAAGGAVVAEGTATQRVRLLPLRAGQPWGSVTATGETGALWFRHVELAQGQLQVLAGARCTIEESLLRDYLEGSNPIVVSESAAFVHILRSQITRFFELDLTRTPVWIEDCLLEYSHADAIDLDASPASTLIRRTMIRHGLGSNTDAIDFGSGSRGTVDSCWIHDFPDKAISVGERSQDVRIHNNLIHSTGIGIAVTEFSTSSLAHNTLVSCGVGLQLYEKSVGEGGGHASAWNNVLWDHELAVLVDSSSTLNLAHSLIQGGWAGGGTGILMSDPQFRDPTLHDYRLGFGSPALASGLGGADMGTLWPVGGLPDTPADLEVVPLNSVALLLRWRDRSGVATRFVIERAPTDGAWEVVGETGPNQTMFIDHPPPAGRDFLYRVVAGGCWGMSFGSEPAVASMPFDRDGDGMSDEWEMAHGLDPTSGHDADLDYDGDGASNIIEYLSGTDPRDPTSVLRLVVTHVEKHSIGFGFQAQPGRAYVLECAQAMPSEHWIPCLELPAQPLVEWILIEAPLLNDEHWYFRVRLQSRP